MGILGLIVGHIEDRKRAKKLRALGTEGLLALDDDAFFNAVVHICEDALFNFKEEKKTHAQKVVCSLYEFETGMCGGLCWFFETSSIESARNISEALEAVGALELKKLFDDFVRENHIDLNDLSGFRNGSFDECRAYAEQFDFDRFEDECYEYADIYQQIIDYARKNIDQIIAE